MRKIKAGVIFYRILCVVAVLQGIFIASITVYTFIAKSLAKGKPIYTVPSKQIPRPAPLIEDNIFTGIGRIRAITGDSPPQTVIVSIAFPYDKADTPFTEELALQMPEFRSVTFAFFKSLSAKDLYNMGEDSIKEALLSRYNAALRLGRIPVLYFNDFMVIE
ncbi:MAG: flagellar basal body-associated FliL family protein [Treponema sp.]|jgi:flagellar basal body-associated protein FliL|nr:flagellar basal body-associated FliL family protein [Treponema sp.]